MYDRGSSEIGRLAAGCYFGGVSNGLLKLSGDILDLTLA
jgi:hypothetical protein